MNESTVQERATAIWVEIWRLAGEQWPPDNIPAAWRVYQHLKQALISAGVSEAQAIAFADDFFYGEGAWGDLTIVDNHKQAINARTVTLLDSEIVGLDEEQKLTREPIEIIITKSAPVAE